MDLEREAEALMPAGAFGYFAGGAGDERVMGENVSAWSEHRLAPRVLVDVSEVDPSVTLLGRERPHPVLVAPMAYQRHAHAEGEAGTARAAVETGSGFVLSSQTTTHPQEVSDVAAPIAPWFQLYMMRDPQVTQALVDAAHAGSYEAIVLTVDFPVGGLRERDHRSGFAVTEATFVDEVLGRVLGGDGGPVTPAVRHAQHDPSLTWDSVARLVETSQVPVLLKGVLRPDDAVRAIEVGAAGVIVSNHGGRQLDAVLPTARALAPVVDAVEGRVPVVVDGGLRRGWDVAIALALGADAVLLGRPTLWGLATGGSDGARAVLAKVVAELENTLALVGCPRARDLDRSFLV